MCIGPSYVEITYSWSGFALGKEAGSCLACAARALASRLITVRFVGVMDVLGPPASSGLLRPPTAVARTPAPTAATAPFTPPLSAAELGDSWLPLAGVAAAVASPEGGDVPAKKKEVIWN